MCKGMKLGAFVLIIASVLLGSSCALAQGQGKEHSEKRPGWQRGENKGWRGDVPPGIEKKAGWMPPGLSKDEQAEWEDGRPPGWSRGKKEGWKSADMPPVLQSIRLAPNDDSQETAPGRGSFDRHHFSTSIEEVLALVVWEAVKDEAIWETGQFFAFGKYDQVQR